MVDWAMKLASDPATPWWVLGVCAAMGVAEMIRTSKETLWGDFFADETDE